MLEDIGYAVRPLSGRSRLKGVRFEDGGGYGTNFGNSGYFQYHPEKLSHHDGAYWKVASGKTGVKHYDMDGNEKTKRHQ